jgi:hypothetical protein
MNTERSDEEMERRLAELVRLEQLKRPLPPYTPPPPTPEQIAAEQLERQRLESLKRPSPLPPRPTPDFAAEQRARMEREKRHERIKAAVNGGLR